MQYLTVAEVLDLARERQGLKSDYALCKALNCSTQLVANWRHGRALPDEKNGQALASLAGIDPFVFIAQMNAQRSKTTEARTIWEAIAERLQMAAHGLAAAVFAVAIATFLLAEDADAAGRAAGVDYVSEGVNSLYIVSSGWLLMCIILLSLASRFDPTFRPCFVPAK